MSWVETARLTVEEIKKKREVTMVVIEAKELVHVTDCERSELSEKRSAHINEAIRLFREKGWVKIFSGYLDCSIYLTRNKFIKVPDTAIPRYTQAELDALKGLSLDELKTLHEAKVLFGGTIHEKEANR
jgi:hypothetical protein